MLKKIENNFIFRGSTPYLIAVKDLKCEENSLNF